MAAETKKPRLESFSLLMAKALRRDASAARGLGQMLLSAELRADWRGVAEVRSALAQSALTLEASALRLEPEHADRPWHFQAGEPPAWEIPCGAEEPSMRATSAARDVTCEACREALRVR